MQCKYCNHKWTPRVAEPLACPSCKRYLGKEKKENLSYEFHPVPKGDK